MMMTTAFLSMWLSNTASTAMMLPIANAILKSLFGERFDEKKGKKGSDSNLGNSNWSRWVTMVLDGEDPIGVHFYFMGVCSVYVYIFIIYYDQG